MIRLSPLSCVTNPNLSVNLLVLTRLPYLGIEHLLGQFGHSHGLVLLASPGGEGCKAWHEEVEPGEGNHVDGELAEVGVELTRKAEAGGHPGHRDLGMANVDWRR